MRMRRKDNLDARLVRCADILTTADLTEKNMSIAAKCEHFFDFSALFENAQNPVHLEIGCGKGRFVCEMAKLYPNINFFAVEKISNVIIEGCESAKAQGLKNVHFLNCAAEVLQSYFLRASVARIYLNFSNPLPKLGYIKQRLTSPRFLSIYEKILSKNGEIWQKTDERAFYEYSLESFSECGYEILETCEDLKNNPFEGNVITEHEQRFMDCGKPIYRIVAVKKS